MIKKGENMLVYIYSLFHRKARVKVILLFICTLIGVIAGVYPVRLIQKIVDLAVINSENVIFDILQVGGVYLFIQIVGAGMEAIAKGLAGSLQADIAFRAQLQLFQALTRTKISAIKESNLTELNSSLVRDTECISQNLIQPYVDAIHSILSFLFGLYFMLKINCMLTLLILPLGLISSFMIKYVTGKSSENLTKQRESMNELWKVFHEGIYGFLPIKLHYYTEQYLSKMKENGEKLRHIQIQQGVLESKVLFWTKTLFMSTIGIILVTAALLVTKNKVSIGGLTAILMYNHMLTDPLLNLLKINQNIVKVNVSFQRIQVILNLPKDEEEIPFCKIDEVQINCISQSIKDRQLFHDLNLNIKAPASLAIFGETGSGKSTLANLIVGILSPGKGTINYRYQGNFVYGRPHISYMIQEEYLFDDTILQNIRIGNPDLSDENFKQILKICELEEIYKNHLGAIGENGSKLSGGERKRLMLARTLADQKADIFIFDELSSSLDSDTFFRIFHSVEAMLDNKIRIYIEHNRQVKPFVSSVICIENNIYF